MAAGLSWSWAGPKQLAPAQDQLRTSTWPANAAFTWYRNFRKYKLPSRKLDMSGFREALYGQFTIIPISRECSIKPAHDQHVTRLNQLMTSLNQHPCFKTYLTCICCICQQGLHYIFVKIHSLFASVSCSPGFNRCQKVSVSMCSESLNRSLNRLVKQLPSHSLSQIHVFLFFIKMCVTASLQK